MRNSVSRNPVPPGIEPAIVIRGLSRRFGDLLAVADVSLTISPGEIFSLIGPNGAGKSTLIRMLTTLLPPSSGEARVAGFDVVSEAAEVRRHIGYVQQLLSADGSLTGYENMLLSARLYTIPRSERAQRIAEALATMNLTDAADRLVQHYSGGMIRELEIAQSMLHRPEVLLMDEPTVGLDPLARRTVHERLRLLRERFGMSMFITTHDMNEAEELCERIALMHQGRITVLGSPEELKAQAGPEATLEDVFAHFIGGGDRGWRWIQGSTPGASRRAGAKLNTAPMSAITDYGTQVVGVADAELRKLRHDFMELITRAIQPALWLLVFGQVMAQVRGLAGRGTGYLEFLAPGILSQSVLFVAIFYGINTIWERDAGILNRYLVSPAPRSALVLGKALSSAVRGLSQAAVVYLLAFLLHLQISGELIHVLGVILFIALGAGVFSTFSVVVACIVRTRERFLGIGQVLTMPIFFASNAIYPIGLMPHWLQIISRLNPLTYEVDALREFMLRNGVSTIGIGRDFLVLITTFAGLIAIASHLYPRMGE